MKATGAEILQFWNEWPPGDDWYWDDIDESYQNPDDGSLIVDHDKKYDLDGFGIMVWQGGSGSSPTMEAPVRGELCVETAAWFRHWRRVRKERSVVFIVPIDAVDEVKKIAAERGWKVIT
ncbi:MAG: hypothetical protein ABL912_01635 [Novosphingobium sp.]